MIQPINIITPKESLFRELFKISNMMEKARCSDETMKKYSEICQKFIHKNT